MVRKSSNFLRMTLAENIKTFRKEKGISQEELANLCSLHRTYIGSVERQERNVTLSTLEVLSETLDVSVPDLLISSIAHRKFSGKDRTDNKIEGLINALRRLSPTQLELIETAILAFDVPYCFWKAPDSDFVSQDLLDNFGDRLLSHHANSHQALSKDRFEFALEAALNRSGISAKLVKSRTNRGHDITIAGVPVSLKTEAAASIREDVIHVSKWMELGKGQWDLPLLRDLFLEHMDSYERVFTLRCLSAVSTKVRYELVEIPKELLLEAKKCELEVKDESKQNPKPGYGHVIDSDNHIKFSLYFDGGTERKLQIKGLRKDLCKVHSTWTFGSAAFE